MAARKSSGLARARRAFLPTAPAPLETRALLSADPITASYQEVLGRSPNPVEWAAADLAVGTGAEAPGAFLVGLYTSYEARADRVNATFQTVLNRPAGAATDYFAPWLGSGGTADDLTRVLLDSGEFAAAHPTDASWNAGAFLATLGRPIDTGTARLFLSWETNFHATHDIVAYVLLHTDERLANEVNAASVADLGRPADPGMTAYFVAGMRGGATIDAVNAALLSSPEGLTHVGLDQLVPVPITGPQPLTLGSMSTADIAATFAPVPTAPALTSRFPGGQVVSQVFRGVGVQAGWYAYAYQFDSGGGLTGASFRFGDTPSQAYLVTSGSVGAMPPSNSGSAVVAVWDSNSATLNVAFPDGLTGNSSTLVVLSRQPPAYQHVVTLSGGGQATAYAPDGGAVGPV